MKRIIAIIMLAAVCTTMLSGCSSATKNTSETTTEATTTTTEATTFPTFENGLSESDFEINEYIVIPSFNEEDTECLLVVKNNSSESVKSINFEVIAYDANNNVVGTNTAYVSKLNPGDETLGTCTFEGIKNVDHISREITKCEVGTFDPDSLDIKLVDMDNMYLYYSVTNNNTKNLSTAYLYVLLFDKDGNLVDYTIGWVTDRILKGDTKVVTAWVGTAKEYDSSKMYCIAFF